MIEGGHAAHALVDVVAVDPHEQNHHRGNSGPHNLQGQVALDGRTVRHFTRSPAKAHQAVHQHDQDADEQHRANAEENLK